MQLSREMVVMGAQAQNKEDALRIVAKSLEEKGFVNNYYDALVQRESKANTYLGAGLSIPHGTLEFKENIKQTGVVLVHFARAVDWGENHQVYLAVGIAAKSDEHLGILTALARLIDKDGLFEQLSQAKTADDVLSALSVASQPTYAGDDLSKPMFTKVIQSSAPDYELLLSQAVSELKPACAGQGFLADLIQKPLMALGQGIFCVQSNHMVKAPACVVALASVPIVYDDAPISALVVLADDKSESARQAFDKLLGGLFELPNLNAESFERLFCRCDGASFVEVEVVLANRHGLHARPATALSQLASRFDGAVLVSKGTEFVSAKSLVRLLSLGAVYGDTLTFKVADDGDKARSFLESLVQAVKDGLGEEVVPIVQTNAPDDDPAPLSAPDFARQSDDSSLVRGDKYMGVIASSGICVGRAYVVQSRNFEIKRAPLSVEKELLLSKQAVIEAKAVLDEAIDKARTREIRDIFLTHKQMLEDDELLQVVERRIKDGLSAPMAWHSEIEVLAKTQGELDNPILAQRAADLKDVGNRVLSVLCGTAQSLPKHSHILVKDEILPSDVATLDEQVLGIITVSGGASSHSAIIARALGIPALVGVGERALMLKEDETVLVDAELGYFVASPSQALVDERLATKARLKAAYEEALENCQLPAITADNYRLEVAVNLGDVSQGQAAVSAGAEGVGLLRTEFVFMKHNKMPDEALQSHNYAQVFDAMAGRPVVVRTLDVGGDKPLPYLSMKKEDNPFLGVRGIRLSLNRPELLKTQLTALIKSSKDRPLAIMFPMVGQIEEWRSAKSVLAEVLAGHPHSQLQVGIMIEVPSAALLAPIFAKEVDFFSIGTNDLTQYTLAIDRGHPALSAMADGLHPSVLKLIDMTVKAAHTHGKWVGVCGELGSDKEAVPILLGLGVDELSVSVSQIAKVKAQIRTLSLAQCSLLAKRALSSDSALAVRNLVREAFE